jgi:hypothetical protein
VSKLTKRKASDRDENHSPRVGRLCPDDPTRIGQAIKLIAMPALALHAELQLVCQPASASFCQI